MATHTAAGQSPFQAHADDSSMPLRSWLATFGAEDFVQNFVRGGYATGVSVLARTARLVPLPASHAGSYTRWRHPLTTRL